jgi:hypothetical protein
MHYGQLRKRLQIVEAARSGLEKKVIADLREKGVGFEFETIKVKFTPPTKPTWYTPDIVLENGIMVECKGFFESKDRTKHLNIKAAHPDLDIRFVFSRSSSPLNKNSNTTYAMWCEDNGFKWADKLIPQEWLEECPGTSLARIIGSADIRQTTIGRQKAGKSGSPTSQSSPSTKRKTRKSGQVSTTTAEKSSTTT